MARFKHESVHLVKMKFLVRLSFIIKRITEVDITQKELAEFIGCSASQISAVKNEREKAVTVQTLMRIADALKLTYSIELRSFNGKVTENFRLESAVEYMKENPIRVLETGIRVLARRQNVVTH
ncbi:HTH DNA binding protein [Erwinia phage vB_EamM_Asesino]|uniref:Transcriptional regulator n=1 Tax=Erwinia phage vB_EamM_Asesino TaxID=1883370 RepID=A0A1B2IA59_9CAUD|nr:HTH DNA binding protein [Erwinia phage vB_EamM_Asesino]ANZ48131.1 putative transcriptional regulator [Erwinia phage vB_EamM_Asesino]